MAMKLPGVYPLMSSYLIDCSGLMAGRGVMASWSLIIPSFWEYIIFNSWVERY